jgi:hypothetical protein
VNDVAPLPPEVAPRGRWWLRGLLLLALAATAWVGWREYDHRAAIREARAAGFYGHSEDAIRRDSTLDVGEGRDLARLRPLLLRLRPTVMSAPACKDTNLDAFHGLSGLRNLSLVGCTSLQNVDALQGLSGLKALNLSDCTSLQNVDGLQGLSGLQTLDLRRCASLQNADGLKGLSGLQILDLRRCTALQNVDGLKGLSGLKELNLRACPKLPAAAVAELRAALPTTEIISD